MYKKTPGLKIFTYVLAVTAAITVSCFDSTRDPNGNGGKGEEDGPIFRGNPPVIINEVTSANVGYRDEFGDASGWVEFYNPADTAVRLGGYYLTNDANRLLWAFGDSVEVAPRSYLTIFLSGRNISNLTPPRDSTNLIANAVGAWNWADDRNTPSGQSTATHAFVPNTSIGGTLNAVSSTTLTWASTTVMMKLGAWGDTNSIDISAANQILLRGNINKDAQLEVRLAQVGTPDWEAWPAVLAGTGIENDLYTIELPHGNTSFPDLANIYGVRFGNPSSFRGTIEFSFSEIVARKRGSDIHVPFQLNRSGGRLFLMDSEGHIRDSIAYPAGVHGLSFARGQNGKWSLSKPPTPNAENIAGEWFDGQAPPLPAGSIPASGFFENSLTFTLPLETDEGVICCDTTGRLPTIDSELRSGVTLELTRTTIMRCARFRQGSYASVPIMRTYIIDDNIIDSEGKNIGKRRPSLPVVSIVVDPVDMFDPVVGMYSMGPNASSTEPYYGANFWQDIELPVHIDFFEDGARHAWSHPAGMSIFGGWSRANAKKSVSFRFRDRYGHRSLRYPMFSEYPHLTRFDSFILRNNGNNFPNDYIRCMLMTSLTKGLGIEYQKGRSVIVYYNGQYFGIHNLRERSTRHYFDTNYNLPEEFLDLIKANGEVNSGSDADYQDIMRWLAGVTPLDDENLRLLDQRIDIDNYTNYIQSQIYFVNKDWPGNNLKRWRVNSPATRWKWFLFDTDHGFDSYGHHTQPSVGMLNFVTAPNGPDWPNPPHSTFLTRKLFENESYRHAFVNRFSLLLATYFTPEKVEARIGALMAPIESEIPIDQARWIGEAPWRTATFMSTGQYGLSVIRNFGRTRPARMQGEIEQFFGLGSPVDFTISKSGNGRIYIHNLEVPADRVTFKAYAEVPMTVKAVPNSGSVFDGWSDGVSEPERVITIEEAMVLEAKFGG
ncbi:MAG: CotH kinase family protein [Chitinispirillales bacterium]|jgi:hypothetical protein|nr:CotH kinase family protein [Chitinispirillales bacterium]